MSTYQREALGSLKSRFYTKLKREFADDKTGDRAFKIFNENWELFRQELCKIAKSKETWLFVYMINRVTTYCPMGMHESLFDSLKLSCGITKVNFSDLRKVKEAPLVEAHEKRIRRRRKKKHASPFFIPRRNFFDNSIKLPDATFLCEFSISSSVLV